MFTPVIVMEATVMFLVAVAVRPSRVTGAETVLDPPLEYRHENVLSVEPLQFESVPPVPQLGVPYVTVPVAVPPTVVVKLNVVEVVPEVGETVTPAKRVGASPTVKLLVPDALSPCRETGAVAVFVPLLVYMQENKVLPFQEVRKPPVPQLGEP